MKQILLLLISAVVISEIFGEELYTDRYDHIDVDEILNNRRLLVPYIKCCLDQGRCTPEGKELKLHIKDAMQNSCGRCTEKQRISARRMVKHIRTHELGYWEELKKKYDPKDEYKEIYEKFLDGED